MEILEPQRGEMVLRLLFTSRLQWETGCYVCVFQVLLWLLVTFFFLWLLDVFLRK